MWLRLLINTCVFSAFLMLSSCYLTTKTPQKVLHLTETDKHGDCVSTGIYTPKTAFERQHDIQWCVEHHPQDSVVRDTCVKNVSAHQTVRSLINFCGAEDTSYFIGIDGVTYALTQTSPKQSQSPYFVGKFTGKQLIVNITNLGLIKKTYVGGTPTTDDNIDQLLYRVRVDVTLEGTSASVEGVLDEGP